MRETNTMVLKFGGSVLSDEHDLPKAVHEIYRHWRNGSAVVAVVSAFGGTTDALIERAAIFGDDLPSSAFAALLATGETACGALLSLALDRSGIPSKLLSAGQAGIRTCGDPLDAEIVSIDVGRIRHELKDSVVIVSGFAGIDSGGDATLLGRGGTDLTALYIARELDARCVLIKDVDGLYDADPNTAYQLPRRYERASYATVARVGGELVQGKALNFAELSDQQFEITSFHANGSTKIGDHAEELAIESDHLASPTRVALIGCGTVGGGVYERLAAMPELFEIVGVVNLDPAKARAAGVVDHHIQRDAHRLIEKDCDVVVELIGGIEPARSFIRQSLRLGRHVVTANKALLASEADHLDREADAAGVSLRYSAAVGGVLPALEAANRAARFDVQSISGVINGTCNYICDQLSRGVSFDDAVRTAQANGYAEADPTLDLDGSDAAQKLMLLVRAAFGRELRFDEIERTGIQQLADQGDGQYRLVAECRKTEDGLHASVRPVRLSPDHPFVRTTGADNWLIIESTSGSRRIFRGRGAGRYATTESVIADLFDVRASLIESAVPRYQSLRAREVAA